PRTASENVHWFPCRDATQGSRSSTGYACIAGRPSRPCSCSGPARAQGSSRGTSLRSEVVLVYPRQFFGREQILNGADPERHGRNADRRADSPVQQVRLHFGDDPPPPSSRVSRGNPVRPSSIVECVTR